MAPALRDLRMSPHFLVTAFSGCPLVWHETITAVLREKVFQEIEGVRWDRVHLQASGHFHPAR